MNCAIVRVEADNAIQVKAQVRSNIATRIHYAFTVAHTGRAGRTSVTEVGDVDVPPDIATEFGHTRVAAQEGNLLDAHLVVTWDAGTIECDLVPPQP